MVKDEFDSIVQDIKDIKIQGANRIALEGIRAATLKNDKQSLKKILSSRPTEPLLQNSIEILEKSNNAKTANKLIKYIETSTKKITKKGANLIKNNMSVFSHCHSTTVMEILKYAKKVQKKDFVVYTLEVEPVLQGRITAKELADAGIKVVVFPDLAAESALRKCDLFLFGADAFLKHGVVNKIGTGLLCKISNEYKIPTYSCGVSLKFTKKAKIEFRSGREVWDERNKKIEIVNPSFDFTKRKYLTGAISEFGILPYKDFIKQAKKTRDNFLI